jgi:excisionase family DNA binding protein
MAGDEPLTTTEAARRLGIEPEDIYRLIFAGELEGSPDSDGVVRISTTAVEDYLERQAHV